MKVICISNVYQGLSSGESLANYDRENIGNICNLIIGKEYELLYDNQYRRNIYVILNKEKLNFISPISMEFILEKDFDKYFITIKEHRNRKIEELLSQ